MQMRGSIPVALTQGVQAKLVRNLCCIHGIWKILLVGEYKQNSITQFILQIPVRKQDSAQGSMNRVVRGFSRKFQCWLQGNSLCAEKGWQTSLLVLKDTPRSAFCVAHHEPLQYGRGHCYPPQRSGLVCFGNSASREVGSAPAQADWSGNYFTR